MGGTGGVTIVQVPDEYEGPIPSRFEGDGPPELEQTEIPGLLAAPGLDRNLYFHEPEDLWYRYTYRRWYQAFRWNGNWFVLEQTPLILNKVEIVVPDKLPTLPEYEEP